MAKDLPYFKFFCSEWSDGDITLEDYEVQGLFINICAYYWSNECVVEYSKLIKKFKGYDLIISNLVNSRILKLKDSFVSISFLDEQLEDREKLSKQNSKNIKDYWDKKRALNERNTSVSFSLNENHSIEIREDKRIEEKKREEKNVVNKFTAPTILEVQTYFNENGFSKELAKRAFDYYEIGNWSDSKGNKVKNWKQKMRGVWFKDENKEATKQKFNPFSGPIA